MTDLDKLLKNLMSLQMPLLINDLKTLAKFDLIDQEIILKAKEYKIPFNIQNPDFSDLEDKISEYKALLNLSCEYQIGWEGDYTEVAILRQLIDDVKSDVYDNSY